MKSPPYATAKRLWSVDSLSLSPADFQQRLDSLLEQTDGLRTHWQLGGAANDYLRRRPGSITVPRGLPFKLLAANHLDSRIIGLKLLVRLDYPLSVTWKWIQRALRSSRDDEVLGGLHELGNLLDKSDLRMSTPASVHKQLKGLGNSREGTIREGALRLIADNRLA